jgi:hypothetical protein
MYNKNAYHMNALPHVSHECISRGLFWCVVVCLLFDRKQLFIIQGSCLSLRRLKPSWPEIWPARPLLWTNIGGGGGSGLPLYECIQTLRQDPELIWCLRSTPASENVWCHFPAVCVSRCLTWWVCWPAAMIWAHACAPHLRWWIYRYDDLSCTPLRMLWAFPAVWSMGGAEYKPALSLPDSVLCARPLLPKW